MKTIWQYIKKFFIWLYDNLQFKDYVIIILVMMCLGFYISSNYYKGKATTPIVIYDTEQVDTYKNKLNEEYKMKAVYVQTIDQLRDSNHALAQEVQNLKDNPVVVTKEVIKFHVDTVFAESDKIETIDSISNLYWSYTEPNNYFAILGNTFVKHDFSDFKTRINNLTVNTELSIDIIEKNKQLSIIGKTTNPYILITNLDGIVLDPTKSKVLKQYYKQKRWNIGPYVGYGVTTDGKFRWNVGVGVSYGLFQF